VLVMSGESTVTPTDIAISHLMITDSRASATRDVGVISYGAALANVVLSRFTFTGGPASAYQGNGPGRQLPHGRVETQNGRPLADQ